MSAPNGFYEVVSIEAGDVVTLAEIKEHLVIDNADDDAILQAYIYAAVESIEAYTNVWLLERSAVGYFPGVCYSGNEAYPWIEIQRCPLKSVESITSWDGVDFIATESITKSRHGFSRVLLSSSQATTADGVAYPIVVEFSAGYGAANIPARFKQAVKMLVSAYYSNRGDCSCGATPGSMTADARAMLYGQSVRRSFA